MKKSILSLLGTLLFLSLNLTAQQVNYKVLHDGPPEPRLNLNFEFLTIDMGVKNLDGMSFNLGLTGFFEPSPGLGLQWNVKRSLFALGKLGYADYPANLDVSTGAYYMISKKQVKKPTKIVLNKEYKGSEFSRNVNGDVVEKRTEEVTFISVPAMRTVQQGFRGGYYLKRGAFSSDEITSEGLTSPLYEMSLTSMGLYAGISYRSLKNIFIETDAYGVQFNSIGDDFVLDLLFVPVNTFRDLNQEDKPNVSEAVKDQLGGLPLGFRIGWYRYQIEKKSRTGKTFGLSASFEAGMKPYQGFFINGGLGLTLIKK